MTWTSPGGVHWESFVEEIFDQWFARPPRFQLDAALAQLQRLGLIIRKWDCIGIPKLTLEVLRDLLIESYDEVLRVYEDLVSVLPSDSADSTNYLQILRRERDYVRPQGQLLALALRNTHEREPVLIMLDRYSWALFVSLAGQELRVVTLYNVTPSGLRMLSPLSRRWEPAQGNHAQQLAFATSAYFRLARRGTMKRYTPEGQAKIQAELDAIDESEAKTAWD
ncbi:hypothetical protein [Streptomyces sp. NPDC001758]